MSGLRTLGAMKERAAELRALVRESDQKPIRVHLDNGKIYTITHPDFALVADGALVIANGPGLGDVSLAICYFEHITQVQVLKKRSKAAA